MRILLIIGMVLGTIIMISLHHLFNWMMRRLFKNNSGDEPLALLGSMGYILINILYIAYLYILFTELNKII